MNKELTVAGKVNPRNSFFFFLILFIFSHSSFLLKGQKPPIKVFILAGQSNMMGTFNPVITDLPAELQDTLSDVLIKVEENTASINWGPLMPGLGAYASNFGPEITFGHDVHSMFQDEKIAIIKYAFGSTTLEYNWRPPSSGLNGGCLFANLVNEINNDLSFLSKNYDPKIVAFCWMQGENDALDSLSAYHYESNLFNLIHDMRNSLQTPKLPFVIGMIADSPHWPYNAVVREAQMRVSSEIKETDIFDTSNLPSDGMHYYSAGQIALGHMFAEKLKEFSAIMEQSGTFKPSMPFPNPASDILHIGIPLSSNESELFLTDLSGNIKIHQKTKGVANIDVDVSVFPKGTYLLKIMTAGASSFSLSRTIIVD